MAYLLEMGLVNHIGGINSGTATNGIGCGVSLLRFSNNGSNIFNFNPVVNASVLSPSTKYYADSTYSLYLHNRVVWVRYLGPNASSYIEVEEMGEQTRGCVDGVDRYYILTKSEYDQLPDSVLPQYREIPLLIGSTDSHNVFSYAKRSTFTATSSGGVSGGDALCVGFSGSGGHTVLERTVQGGRCFSYIDKTKLGNGGSYSIDFDIQYTYDGNFKHYTKESGVWGSYDYTTSVQFIFGHVTIDFYHDYFNVTVKKFNRPYYSYANSNIPGYVDYDFGNVEYSDEFNAYDPYLLAVDYYYYVDTNSDDDNTNGIYIEEWDETNNTYIRSLSSSSVLNGSYTSTFVGKGVLQISSSSILAPTQLIISGTTASKTYDGTPYSDSNTDTSIVCGTVTDGSGNTVNVLLRAVPDTSNSNGHFRNSADTSDQINTTSSGGCKLPVRYVFVNSSDADSYELPSGELVSATINKKLADVVGSTVTYSNGVATVVPGSAKASDLVSGDTATPSVQSTTVMTDDNTDTVSVIVFYSSSNANYAFNNDTLTTALHTYSFGVGSETDSGSSKTVNYTGSAYEIKIYNESGTALTESNYSFDWSSIENGVVPDINHLPFDSWRNIYPGEYVISCVVTKNGNQVFSGSFTLIIEAHTYGFKFDGVDEGSSKTMTYDGSSHTLSVYEGGSALASTSDYNFSWTLNDVAVSNNTNSLTLSKDVGTYNVVCVISDKSNNQVGECYFSLTINEKLLTFVNAVIGNFSDKTYDGTALSQATVSGGSVSGFVGNDSASLGTSLSYDPPLSKNCRYGDYNYKAIVTYSLNPASGTSLSNYEYEFPQTTKTAEITQKTLIPSAVSKVYDGNDSINSNNSVITFSSGVVSGDDVTVIFSSTSGFDGDVDVDDYPNILVLFSLSGSDASNYSINPSRLLGHITPKQLTIEGTSIQNKTYDGTTNSTVVLGTVGGIVSRGGVLDDVVVIPSHSFPSANAGTYSNQTVTYTLDGNHKDNYYSPASTTGLLATISAAVSYTFKVGSSTVSGNSHTVSYNGSNYAVRVYADNDATTTANYAFSWAVTEGGTTTTSTNAILSFSSAKTYQISCTLTSKATGEVVWSGSFTLIINKANLTVSGTVVENKTYDGTTTAVISSLGTVSGIASNDLNDENKLKITASTSFSTSQATSSNQTLTISYNIEGSSAGNYNRPSNTTVSAKINPVNLTVSGTSVSDKLYDGTTSATVNLGTVSGIVEGDVVSVVPSALFSSSAPGDYSVVVSYSLSGLDRTNYNAPSNDTVTATIYDAVSHAYALRFDGEVCSGNSATIKFDGNSHTLAIFDNGEQVSNGYIFSWSYGSNQSVSTSTLSFTAAGTYVVSYTVRDERNSDVVLSGTFTLTIEHLIQYGVYDSSAPTGSQWVYPDENMSVTKTYKGTSYSVWIFIDNSRITSVASSSNYAITWYLDGSSTGTSSTSRTVTSSPSHTVRGVLTLKNENNAVIELDPITVYINKKQLTISSSNPSTVANKTYDGTTSATVTLGTVEGIYNNNATVTATAAFRSVDCGSQIADITYAVSNTNYLPPLSDAVSAVISPKTIRITGISGSVSKTYDGNTNIDLLAATDPLPSTYNDEVFVINSNQFSNKNVGENKTINITYSLEDVVMGSNKSGNYVIDAGQYTSVTGSIIQRTVGVIGNSVQKSKEYDGSTAAAVVAVGSLKSGGADGVVAGDSVVLSAVANYSGTADAGTDKTIVETFTLTGSDAGNYIVGSNNTATFTGCSIDKKRLGITGTSVTTKYYDGSNSASIVLGSLSGVVNNQSVSVVSSGSFPDVDQGSYNVVVSYTLSGASSVTKNYLAPFEDIVVGVINSRPLTISGISSVNR